MWLIGISGSWWTASRRPSIADGAAAQPSPPGLVRSLRERRECRSERLGAHWRYRAARQHMPCGRSGTWPTLVGLTPTTTLEPASPHRASRRSALRHSDVMLRCRRGDGTCSARTTSGLRARPPPQRRLARTGSSLPANLQTGGLPLPSTTIFGNAAPAGHAPPIPLPPRMIRHSDGKGDVSARVIATSDRRPPLAPISRADPLSGCRS